jgi:hypothetical protein
MFYFLNLTSFLLTVNWNCFNYCVRSLVAGSLAADSPSESCLNENATSSLCSLEYLNCSEHSGDELVGLKPRLKFGPTK